jgi:hypothetical protein
MDQLPIIINGTTHQVYDALLGAAGRRRVDGAPVDEAPVDVDRDRGAVSLEQVLWFVAAGVSVAVIAAILWNQIRDQAETEVEVPVAPAPNP